MNQDQMHPRSNAPQLRAYVTNLLVNFIHWLPYGHLHQSSSWLLGYKKTLVTRQWRTKKHGTFVTSHVHVVKF